MVPDPKLRYQQLLFFAAKLGVCTRALLAAITGEACYRGGGRPPHLIPMPVRVSVLPLSFLQAMDKELQVEENKVKGCQSTVYVRSESVPVLAWPHGSLARCKRALDASEPWM